MARITAKAVKSKLDKLFKARSAAEPPFIALVNLLVDDKGIFDWFYENDSLRDVVAVIEWMMQHHPDITVDQWDALQSKSRGRIQTQCALALIHHYNQPQPKARPRLIEKIPSGPITHVMHSFTP